MGNILRLTQKTLFRHSRHTPGAEPTPLPPEHPANLEPVTDQIDPEIFQKVFNPPSLWIICPMCHGELRSDKGRTVLSQKQLVGVEPFQCPLFLDFARTKRCDALICRNYPNEADTWIVVGRSHTPRLKPGEDPRTDPKNRKKNDGAVGVEREWGWGGVKGGPKEGQNKANTKDMETKNVGEVFVGYMPDDDADEEQSNQEEQSNGKRKRKGKLAGPQPEVIIE